MRRAYSRLFVVGVVVCSAALSATARAQSLNWEGQTGGIFTPSAMVAESPASGVGRPSISFYWLNGGDVVSNHFRTSLTIGLADAIEVGVTRSSIASGESSDMGSLFDRGFTSVHGKVRVVPENAGGTRAPAVSVGAILRWQAQHLEGALGAATQNGDIYVAASKTLPIDDRVAVVVTGGLKLTNASLFGLAGNTPDWTARGFASGNLELGEMLVIGGEFVQQPDEIEGIARSSLPATLAFFVRVSPVERLSVSAAMVRLGNEIAPGFDAKAGSRFLLGVGFRF
jgi:hypothetical protein